MKLIISILLFFTLQAEGQVIRANPFYRPFASGCDADAQKFIDSAGITDPTQKDAICTLVKDLKDSSLWSSMIAIYPIVGGTADKHKWNLKNPATFKLSYSGSITHSSTGMVSAGGYALTGINPSVDVSQNSVHLSFYAPITFTGFGSEFGAEGGSPYVYTRLAMSYGGYDYSYANNTEILKD
jgi:hypothetical protein